jgi:hypothetical protein
MGSEAKQDRQDLVYSVARRAVLVSHHDHLESQSSRLETMCQIQKERCRGEKSCQDRRSNDGACACSVEHLQTRLEKRSIDETCDQVMVQMGRDQLRHFPACHGGCLLMVWVVAERKANRGTVLTPAVTLAMDLHLLHLN